MNQLTQEQIKKATEVEQKSIELFLEGKEEEAQQLINDELGVFIAETLVDNYVRNNERNIFNEEEMEIIREVEKEATQLALAGDKEEAVKLVQSRIGEFTARDILNNYKRAYEIQQARKEVEKKINEQAADKSEEFILVEEESTEEQ